MHEENCFITLTYSDENLVHGGQTPTLYPRDLQLFLKKLRKKFGKGIRFFACGEYGDENNRPHYHACIFGMDFKDKQYYRSRKGIKYYVSQTLAELWPQGTHTIGECNFETAAYVARYVMKKKTGPHALFYKELGILPEFTRMSRRPGVGSGWLEKYQSDVFPRDYIVIRGGKKCTPPKYYTSKYEITNPEQYTILKLLRRKQQMKNLKNNTLKRLIVREEVKKSQIKSLSRKL